MLDERWNDCKADHDAGIISQMPKRLKVIREITAEILKSESAEVKAEVEKFREELKGRLTMRHSLSRHLRKVLQNRNKPHKHRST